MQGSGLFTYFYPILAGMSVAVWCCYGTTRNRRVAEVTYILQ